MTTDTKAKPKPAAEKKDTKKAKATVIIAKNHAKMTTKDLVSELMTHCGLSDFGARTYVYNIRKELGLVAPPRQVAAKKAPATAAKTDTKKAKAAPKRKSKTEAKAPADDEAVANKVDAASAIND
jgi:transposase